MDGIILKEIIVNKTQVEFRFETKGKIEEYFNTNCFLLITNTI
jgi:hypothetical protein